MLGGLATLLSSLIARRCFISFSYLDLYVLGYDALIRWIEEPAKVNKRLESILIKKNEIKVVGDPCQKITLLLLKSKSVRVIVPESFFLKRILICKT